MSNPNGSNGQNGSNEQGEVNLARDLLQKARGSVPESMLSVLERLASQFDAMFNGQPGTGVANPAPPSVEPIPSEWDAAFNGSIPPVTPIAIPSPNDPKTPPDWHLTDAPAAPVAATPAPAKKVVTVEIPADIPDPDWECNVKISSEEYAIIDAYREKKHASQEKVEAKQKTEDKFNTGVDDIMDFAKDFYKRCYIPCSVNRKRMFIPQTARFGAFCELVIPAVPMERKKKMFKAVNEVIYILLSGIDHADAIIVRNDWLS